MTSKMSPYKLERLLAMHFAGDSQLEIAHKLNVDQSTVSVCIKKFAMQSEEKGLLAASKEKNIMDLVSALHSLGAELKSSKLTAEEAKLGLRARLKLEGVGVKEERYPELIQSVAKMKEGGFLDAALKMVSLEASAGQGYFEIVAKYEAIVKQMGQKTEELAGLSAAVAEQESELKAIMGKRKASGQEYNSYLQQTGMNMKRLQTVEKLAGLLKQAGVNDGALDDYIQRQQQLAGNGLDIALFGKIVSKASALALVDGGKQLLHMLTEYGSLQAAIESLSVKEAGLEKHVVDLSEKAENRKQLVEETGRLVAEKKALACTVKDLEEKAIIKERLEYEASSLRNSSHEIEMEVKALQSRKLTLEEEVVATKSKLAALEPMREEHQGLTTKLATLERAFAQRGRQYDLFLAFLGFLQNTTVETVQRFVEMAPEMVKWAKEGEYSTVLISKQLLNDLTMGRMNVYTCMACRTRFFVDSAPKWGGKPKCPNCSGGVSVIPTTDAYDVLSQAESQT